MEESNSNKEKSEFLGKKREYTEIKLDSISEYDDEKSEKNLMNDLTIKHQKDNICKICGKNIDILKFENTTDILNYLEKEKFQIPDNLELDRNNNILFNTIKIICKECLQKILYDKIKYNDFFLQSIEIINEESEEPEININEEQPILINELESSKNDNEQKNEEQPNNIILSNSEKEGKNNQDKNEEEEKNKINNNEIKNDININPPQKEEIKNVININPPQNEEIKNDINNNNSINIQNKQENKIENDINKNNNENINQKTEQNIEINNNENNINNLNQNNQFVNLNVANSENFQQNIQNLLIQNYLANLNMYKQAIEQEMINSKNSQENNNENINAELIQEQQALYMNALLQYLNYYYNLHTMHLNYKNQ